MSDRNANMVGLKDKNPFKLSDSMWSKLRIFNGILAGIHGTVFFALLGVSLSSSKGLVADLFNIISNPDPANITAQMYELQSAGTLTLQWLVVAFFGVTAFAHGIYACNFRNFYRNALEKGGG